ncbi:phage tail-collar fiber domain-containing protein [Vibrio anguillarum]|uniref:phage tail-collar fiber domain-containing protein n=1 Tax=Vibrio anguillarum TaxID=55601 RepID=UPI00097E1D4C|nr:phage tail protein [Vibrio anguillarum]QCW19929.1 tail protein [Vibrio phage Va_PF430-3_p42]AQM21490.1 hypothetical protein PN51_16965 [Vibrio anguillarum]AUB86141.1 phage tail protein [Vibrio anguillarum]AUB89579.1 phage tail protein [Vibrio anguillarum]AUB93021.1 phage tail protein [Vibrio anguillarum]
MANQDTDLRCYLTNAGIAAENNSIQLGRKLPVKEMVFGSGLLADESDPRLQTTMIQEEYTVPCGMLFDPESPTLLVFKGDLPADVGGFHINEVAIRLEDGTLYGYARGKGDYKPTIEQGATDSVRYAVEMYTTNASNVECKIDLSKVYVDWEDLEARIKAHTDDNAPHPQYATDDDLTQAKQQAKTDWSNLVAVSQFLPYDQGRKYKTGEICYTINQATGELAYWQWYSNVESLAGKWPLSEGNRHAGWSDNTKPFYWIPYTGDQVGMPFLWLAEEAPEWAVMEINVDLPTAVYWRLARRYPHLVSGGTINTGEIRGEFLRVLDQGRGVDAGRVLGSHQSDDFEAHYHPLTAVSGGAATSPSFPSAFASPYFSGNAAKQNDGSFANAGALTYGAAGQGAYQSPEQQKSSGNGIETRPRNIARSMAIVI